MKKIAKFITLTAAILLFAGGCSNNSAKTQESSDTTAGQTQTEEITIYVARHGKTMLNTTDRSQGWIDAPLTPAGVEVAEQLGRGLADVTFDAAYSSDSGRAIETATLVLKNNGQEDLVSSLTQDDRLREFNFGTYEGMPNEEMWETIAEHQGLTLEEWQNNMAVDGFVTTIEGFADTLAELDKENVEDGVNWPAEDFQTVADRVTAGLADIVKDAQEQQYENVLVVSHGMTIATLVTQLDAKAEVPATGLKNASIAKIIYKDGTYTVEAVNDMSYVEAGQK